MKKITAFILAVLLALSCAYITNDSVLAASDEKIKIAYIPIDDRPVNTDRVKYLAESANIELLMPETDLFRTALDNMTPNSNGTTYGDREKLLEWLESIEDECDYYALSLDQLLSGGLVSSRWLSNTDLTTEYAIADKIISLADNHNVVLFDTVMRLASTVGYEGYTIDEYNALRNYGSKARKQLYGKSLNVENIINGYKYGVDGTEIQTSLDSEKIDKYIASRTRKLNLIDYILQSSCGKIDCIMIGVDDSSNTTNIQTNEIRYVRSLIGDNGACFAATDELGIMSVTRIITGIYGGAEVKVTYFGGAENDIADAYDFESLRTSVTTHLNLLRCTETTDGNTLSVLIFTNCSGKRDAARALTAQANENIKNNIPTIIIDPSGTSNKQLQEALRDSGIDLGLLLGYSSWNTAANAVGIALCNGISRYAYLKTAHPATDESNRAFVQGLTFSFIKDISYKKYGKALDGTETSYPNAGYFVNRLEGSKMLIGVAPYRTAVIGDISVHDAYKPWNRAFEATAAIDVETPEYAEIIPGDTNGNGVCDVSDYITTQLYVLHLVSLTDDALVACDFDLNGVINADDYIAVRLTIMRINK